MGALGAAFEDGGDALRERVLRLAQEDDSVVAGAIVGSLAVDGGDRFSDMDFTFGIADGVRVAHVLEDWTRTLVDEFDAVRLAELERGPTTYRVFLLPDALQLDLSMTSAARFRPAGPRFRLLFGETAAGGFETPAPSVAGDLFLPTPLVARDHSGGASSTRSTRARASSAGVSGKRSITSGPSIGRLPVGTGPAERKANFPASEGIGAYSSPIEMQDALVGRQGRQRIGDGAP